jgi:hypothetical protein
MEILIFWRRRKLLFGQRTRGIINYDTARRPVKEKPERR